MKRISNYSQGFEAIR